MREGERKRGRGREKKNAKLRGNPCAMRTARMQGQASPTNRNGCGNTMCFGFFPLPAKSTECYVCENMYVCFHAAFCIMNEAYKVGRGGGGDEGGDREGGGRG